MGAFVNSTMSAAAEPLNLMEELTGALYDILNKLLMRILLPFAHEKQFKKINCLSYLFCFTK